MMKFSALLLLATAASFANTPLNDLLAPYIDLTPSDSITALHARPGSLGVSLLRGKDSLSLQATVSVAYRAKILAEAKSEGVAIDSTEPLSPAASSPLAPLALNTSRRTAYVSSQASLSWYIYGIGLPVAAKETDAKVFGGIELLAIPSSIFAHIFLSQNREYGEGQFNGIHDYTWSTMVAGYAGGFALWGEDFAGFQTAAVATAIAYPFALHYGYDYGTRYRDNPGRIDLRSSLAGIGGIGGFILPLALSDGDGSADLRARLAMASILAGYAGGHLLGDAWQPDANVAGGIGSGISQMSLLGALWGVELDKLADIHGTRASAMPFLLGGLGGATFGWHYLKGSPDSHERSGYTALGMWAGYIGACGILLMADGSDRQSDGALVNTLVIGPTVGYLAARALTTDLVETPKDPKRTSKTSWIRGTEFNPIPELAYVRRSPQDGLQKEWRVPGLMIHM